MLGFSMSGRRPRSEAGEGCSSLDGSHEVWCMSWLDHPPGVRSGHPLGCDRFLDHDGSARHVYTDGASKGPGTSDGQAYETDVTRAWHSGGSGWAIGRVLQESSDSEPPYRDTAMITENGGRWGGGGHA
jgi:hypothetical protein